MSELASIQDAWTRLTTHLDWADRFWVAFLFCDDPRVIEVLAGRAQGQIEGAGRRFMKLRPDSPEDITELIEALVEGCEGGVAWVDLVRHDDTDTDEARSWTAAWDRVMLRLNERRERLSRGWSPGGIVFATTLDRLDGTAALAPDLWTLRAMLLRLAPQPAERQIAMPKASSLIEKIRAAKRKVETLRDPNLARQAVERARVRGDGLGLFEAFAVLASAEQGEAALKAAREARDMVTGLLDGADDGRRSRVAARLRQLGEVFTREDARAGAEACWRQSIDLEEAIHGTRERVEVADGLEGLAEAIARLDGVRLDELPRADEALQMAREGLEIRRALAPRRPAPATPGLAKALSDLGIRLLATGRREEAIEVEREAVELHRELANTDPDAFLPDLAKTLDRLGVCLREWDRREDATAATREAVEIYRELASANPSTFIPHLARALDNLERLLSSLGRREDAVKVAREAVELFRRLANANPDACLPDLARALSHLGLRLGELGQREQAGEVEREAVDLLRPLADANPDAFLSDLAGALNNLGIGLGELGLREQAMNTTAEAVDIQRELVKTNPDVFMPDLAWALSNLSVCLSELGRHEQAVTAARESVELHRALANTSPDTFVHGLAVSFAALGAAHELAGRYLEARDDYAEALRALVPLFERLPGAHGHVAATLAHRLDRLHRAHGAVIPEDLEAIVAHMMDVEDPGPPSWRPEAFARQWAPISIYPPPPEPAREESADDPEPKPAELQASEPRATYVLRWLLLLAVVTLVIGLIWVFGQR